MIWCFNAYQLIERNKKAFFENTSAKILNHTNTDFQKHMNYQKHRSTHVHAKKYKPWNESVFDIRGIKKWGKKIYINIYQE